METKILGDSIPVVTCKLKKGESVVTESGGMSWMDEGIKMSTLVSLLYMGPKN